MRLAQKRRCTAQGNRPDLAVRLGGTDNDVRRWRKAGSDRCSHSAGKLLIVWRIALPAIKQMVLCRPIREIRVSAIRKVTEAARCGRSGGSRCDDDDDYCGSRSSAYSSRGGRGSGRERDEQGRS
jgi:hypothetical protein